MKKTSLIALALVAGFASASEAKISQYATGKVSLNSVKSEGEWNSVLMGDGLTYTNDSSFDAKDNGTGISVGYGLDFGNGFRADAELSHNSTTKDAKMSSTTVTVNGQVMVAEPTVEEMIDKPQMETKSTTMMLNGYYDIKTGTEWTPYVTAGIGYAHIDNTCGSTLGMEWPEKHRADNLAYQAGFGVGYALTSNITLDAGYKYVDLGKTEHTRTTKEEDFGMDFVRNSSYEIKNTMSQLSVGARMAF